MIGGPDDALESPPAGRRGDGLKALSVVGVRYSVQPRVEEPSAYSGLMLLMR
jgi:hypothetical protein